MYIRCLSNCGSQLRSGEYFRAEVICADCTADDTQFEWHFETDATDLVPWANFATGRFERSLQVDVAAFSYLNDEQSYAVYAEGQSPSLILLNII